MGALQMNKLVVNGKIIKLVFSHGNKLIMERLEGREGERHVRMLEKSMEISHLCLCLEICSLFYLKKKKSTKT